MITDDAFRPVTTGDMYPGLDWTKGRYGVKIRRTDRTDGKMGIAVHCATDDEVKTLLVELPGLQHKVEYQVLDSTLHYVPKGFPCSNSVEVPDWTTA